MKEISSRKITVNKTITFYKYTVLEVCISQGGNNAAEITKQTDRSFFCCCVSVYSATLKEMYDRAQSQDGYDRYIKLETGVTCTGWKLPVKHITEKLCC